ncbi:MAG: cytochrome c3 family protein [Fidelibacterota bacterium]
MKRPGFILLAIVLFAFLAISILALNRRPPPIEQPLAFNHLIHAGEQDLECTFCHRQVENHARATLPPVDACRECHEEAITETPLEEKLLAFTTENREIPWNAIYDVPDHVYFSHRRHVTLGSVPCETCHGQVPSLSEPPPRPLVSITMEFCMDCHEEHQVTNDCLACHR